MQGENSSSEDHPAGWELGCSGAWKAETRDLSMFNAESSSLDYFKLLLIDQCYSLR